MATEVPPTPPPPLSCTGVMVSPNELTIKNPGETRSLTAAASGGVPPYIFTWSQTTVDPPGTLSPTSGMTTTWTAPLAPVTGQSWTVTVTLSDSTGQIAPANPTCSKTFTFTPPPPPPEPEPMKTQLKVALAIYFILLGLLLISGAIAVGWGGLALGSTEVRIATIAALAGGLGALVQSTTSFITYAGERKLYTSWGWWYVMRPVIGAGLALIFYFAFRGGLLLLSTSSDALKADNINIFGVGAIGGLVGMFSKEATDKLQELAEAIFKKQPRADSR